MFGVKIRAYILTPITRSEASAKPCNSMIDFFIPPIHRDTRICYHYSLTISSGRSSSQSSLVGHNLSMNIFPVTIAGCGHPKGSKNCATLLTGGPVTLNMMVSPMSVIPSLMSSRYRPGLYLVENCFPRSSPWLQKGRTRGFERGNYFKGPFSEFLQ